LQSPTNADWKSDLEKTMRPTLIHRRNTDVAHIEIRATGAHAPVQVEEIGHEFGFPGLVLVRYNPESGDVYGFTIQRWSHVRRRLMWQYRTIKAKEAMERMIKRLLESWRPSEHRVLALTH
jgi:hypothetical protein